MAKIKTQVYPHANGLIDLEVIQAAQAAMPNSEPSAEVIRDLNGKVVEVHVNLPDGDAPGLANAKNAINANSGVAKASEFPKNIANDDFNSLTPGDTLATVNNNYVYDGGVGSVGCIEILGSNTSTSLLRAAFAAESDGSSALMFQPRNSSASFSSLVSGVIRFPGLANDFDLPVSWSTEFDLKRPATINSVSCEVPDSTSLEIRAYPLLIGNSNELVIEKLSGQSTFQIRSAGATGNFDTGITVGTSHSIKVQMSTVAGFTHIVTIDGNVFLVEKSATFAIQNNMYMSVLHRDNYLTSAVRNADENAPLIIDNLVMKIQA